MLHKLYPCAFYDSIFTIPYETLLQDNIRCLIFDVDNTLVPFDIPEPTQEISDLFAALKTKGFSICLLSNNHAERVDLFNKKLGLFSIANAKKPGAAGITKAMQLLRTTKKEVALIGDQVFTDCWCGNRQGVYTILVKPVATRDELSVRLKRGVEKIVINSYQRQVKKNDKPTSKR